jgi:hypothetical protein
MFWSLKVVPFCTSRALVRVLVRCTCCQYAVPYVDGARRRQIGLNGDLEAKRRKDSTLVADHKKIETNSTFRSNRERPRTFAVYQEPVQHTCSALGQAFATQTHLINAVVTRPQYDPDPMYTAAYKCHRTLCELLYAYKAYNKSALYAYRNQPMLQVTRYASSRQ